MNIEQELKDLEEASKVAGICGGTVSSSQLKMALVLRRQAKNPKQAKKLDKIIEIWRNQLKIHNAQPVKVHEYDLNTGETKD